LSILYGTVEYFENQIADHLGNNKPNIWEEELNIIFFELEKEIFNRNFVHNEKMRLQFLNNLAIAVRQSKDKLYIGINR
jgi:hypothetical protein